MKPNRFAILVVSLLMAGTADASMFQGETLDKVADFLAWFVLILLPAAGIYLFWMVHILPEKIAHDRHHPQKDAIQTLCILSLFFGGLLWPLAWLWAYSKPVMYKMAYGTDKVYGDERDDVGKDNVEKLQLEIDSLKAALAASQAQRST